MRVKLWGTRGSLASPGPDTARYGGNTVSVEVWSDDGHLLVLDAGTGARRLGATLAGKVRRIVLGRRIKLTSPMLVEASGSRKKASSGFLALAGSDWPEIFTPLEREPSRRSNRPMVVKKSVREP